MSRQRIFLGAAIGIVAFFAGALWLVSRLTGPGPGPGGATGRAPVAARPQADPVQEPLAPTPPGPGAARPPEGLARPTPAIVSPAQPPPAVSEAPPPASDDDEERAGVRPQRGQRRRKVKLDELEEGGRRRSPQYVAPAQSRPRSEHQLPTPEPDPSTPAAPEPEQDR